MINISSQFWQVECSKSSFELENLNSKWFLVQTRQNWVKFHRFWWKTAFLQNLILIWRKFLLFSQIEVVTKSLKTKFCIFLSFLLIQTCWNWIHQPIPRYFDFFPSYVQSKLAITSLRLSFCALVISWNWINHFCVETSKQLFPILHFVSAWLLPFACSQTTTLAWLIQYRLLLKVLSIHTDSVCQKTGRVHCSWASQ